MFRRENWKRFQYESDLENATLFLKVPAVPYVPPGGGDQGDVVREPPVYTKPIKPGKKPKQQKQHQQTEQQFIDSLAQIKVDNNGGGGGGSNGAGLYENVGFAAATVATSSSGTQAAQESEDAFITVGEALTANTSEIEEQQVSLYVLEHTTLFFTNKIALFR